METIIITGKVLEHCETCKDNNGKEYIRFKVACMAKAGTPAERITIYRCFFYNTKYANLTKGEVVIIIGDLSSNTRIDKDGHQWANLDIYVKQLNCPLRENK